jgi:hypothetical protein
MVRWLKLDMQLFPSQYSGAHMNILFIVEARIPFLSKWSHREAGDRREKLPGGRHVEEAHWSIGMQNVQEDNELFGTRPFRSGMDSCRSTVL